MTRAEVVMEKIATIDKEAKDKKTYPGSRAHETYKNVGTYGLSGFIENRALQGRKNIGKAGLSESENKVMGKITKDETGSHPIARTLTSPAAVGGLLGTEYAALGASKGGAKGAVGGAIAGAALGAGSAALSRWTHARALMGRAAVGREGWGTKEKSLIKQLKEKE
jgi:hypothetical protein